MDRNKANDMPESNETPRSEAEPVTEISSYDIREEIEKGVESGTIAVDMRGHFHGYRPGWFKNDL